MKYLTIGTVLKVLKEYSIMAFGMFLYAFGWIGCVKPADGTGGGAGGLGYVLSEGVNAFGESLGYDWGIKMGTMVLAINAVLILIGGLIVGWNFGIKTIYSIIMISVSMNFWQWFIEESGHASAIFPIFEPTEHLLPMILGGIFAGIGIALCFSQGGTTGGTDIVALIIQKYHNVNYGKILIYTDAVIIGSALFVGKGLSTLIYGYVMTVVVAYTVDMLMSGNNQSHQVFIITKDYEKMAEAVSSNMHRGVTLIDSQGWYSKEPGKMVMVICRKRETPMLLKFVRSVDSAAFISVGPVMGVYGQGFQPLTKL